MKHMKLIITGALIALSQSALASELICAGTNGGPSIKIFEEWQSSAAAAVLGEGDDIKLLFGTSKKVKPNPGKPGDFSIAKSITQFSIEDIDKNKADLIVIKEDGCYSKRICSPQDGLVVVAKLNYNGADHVFKCKGNIF